MNYYTTVFAESKIDNVIHNPAVTVLHAKKNIHVY